MARRPALRLAIDLVVAAALAAAIAVVAARAFADDTPPMPPGICAGDGRPRYDALVADGRLAVAALFGQIEDGPVATDFGARSRRMLEDALVARGYVAVAPDRYQRAATNLTVDVAITGPAALPRALPAVTAVALTAALERHDLVYYNGHVFEGTATLSAPPDAYRVIVLDSCWSTQRYAPRLIGPTTDVIGNRERAITGSVASFVALLDGLDRRAPSWAAILAPMNQLADARAANRAGRSHWRRPERYALDVACPSP